MASSGGEFAGGPCIANIQYLRGHDPEARVNADFSGR
jgi:hypothetical protein